MQQIYNFYALYLQKNDNYEKTADCCTCFICFRKLH